MLSQDPGATGDIAVRGAHDEVAHRQPQVSGAPAATCCYKLDIGSAGRTRVRGEGGEHKEHKEHKKHKTARAEKRGKAAGLALAAANACYPCWRCSTGAVVDYLRLGRSQDRQRHHQSGHQRDRPGCSPSPGRPVQLSTAAYKRGEKSY